MAKKTENEALLAAITNAIDALAEVKAELEKEAAAPSTAETVGEITPAVPIEEPAPQAPQEAAPAPVAEAEFAPQPALEPQPTPVVQSAPVAAPAGNVCPNCGRPISPGTKFCMGCGAPIQQPAPAAQPQGGFCMKCGAPLVPGDKFCMKCGAMV